MKSIPRKIANAVFVALVFGLTLWSVFRGENLTQVLFHLKSVNILYILAAVGCVLVYILADAVSVFFLLRSLSVQISLPRCCLYSFIGFFYCCITPSASGGQPMQVLYMRRGGIPVAISTVVLAIITIVYKLALVLATGLILLFRPPSLMICLKPVIALVYLGLGLNILCITALFFLVFYPAVTRTLAEKTFRLLHRIRPMKHLSRRQTQLELILRQYQGAAAYYRSHRKDILYVFTIALLQRFFLFLVTWFTYRSFSLSGSSLPLITALQSMISIAADVLPLPGGMGVSENMFLEIFPAIFGQELVLPGMMISRGISYYTQLLISALMTALAHILLMRRPSQKATTKR